MMEKNTRPLNFFRNRHVFARVRDNSLACTSDASKADQLKVKQTSLRGDAQGLVTENRQNSGLLTVGFGSAFSPLCDHST